MPEQFLVDPRACRFTLQEVSVPHLFPHADLECEQGAIVVSRMNDGNWFVHNGRHRVIRELMAEHPQLLVAVDLY